MKLSFSVLNYIHLRSIPRFSFDGLRGVKRMWVSVTIWSSTLTGVHVYRTFPIFSESLHLALNLNVLVTKYNCSVVHGMSATYKSCQYLFVYHHGWAIQLFKKIFWVTIWKIMHKLSAEMSVKLCETHHIITFCLLSIVWFQRNCSKCHTGNHRDPGLQQPPQPLRDVSVVKDPW